MKGLLRLTCVDEDGEEDGAIFVWFGVGVAFYESEGVTVVEGITGEGMYHVRESPEEIEALLNKQRYE